MPTDNKQKTKVYTNKLEFDKANKAYQDSLNLFNTQNKFNADFINNFKVSKKPSNIPVNIWDEIVKAAKSIPAPNNKTVQTIKNALTQPNGDTFYENRPDEGYPRSKFYVNQAKEGKVKLREGNFTPNNIANQYSIGDIIFNNDTKNATHKRNISTNNNIETIQDYTIDSIRVGLPFNKHNETFYNYGFKHQNIIDKNIKPVSILKFNQDVNTNETRNPMIDGGNPKSNSYSDKNVVNIDLPIYKKPTDKPIYQPDVTNSVPPIAKPKPNLVKAKPKLVLEPIKPLGIKPMETSVEAKLAGNIAVPAMPTTKGVTQNYTGSKALQIQGKSSGYINKGDNTGRQEFRNGGWLDGMDNNIKQEASTTATKFRRDKPIFRSESKREVEPMFDGNKYVLQHLEPFSTIKDITNLGYAIYNKDRAEVNKTILSGMLPFVNHSDYELPKEVKDAVNRSEGQNVEIIKKRTKQNGGWLEGLEEGKTEQAPDVTNATEYIKNWYNSPMYGNILKNQIADSGVKNPKRIERVAKRSIKFANKEVNSPFYNVTPNIVDDPEYYGRSIDDHKGGRKINLNRNFVKNNPKLVNSLFAHELAHDNLMTDLDKRYVNQKTMYSGTTPGPDPGDISKDWYNTITDPGEVRSQIHSIRQLSKENQIYDPFTEPFKKEYLDKVNESYKQGTGTEKYENYNQLKRLRQIYSDDQITEMMNTISKSNSNDGKVYAKNGGWLDGLDKNNPIQDNTRVKTTVIPNQALIQRAKFIENENLEEKVNKFLNYPMDKAKDDAESEDEGEDPIDNFRHAQAGRYTNEAIANKFPKWSKYTGIPQAIGFAGSTALGIAHEITSPNTDPKYSKWDTFREGLEDTFNNTVGAGVGSLPISTTKKTSIIKSLSNNNNLPDGYGKGNMYFKKKFGGWLDNLPNNKFDMGGVLDGLDGVDKGTQVPDATATAKPVVNLNFAVTPAQKQLAAKNKRQAEIDMQVDYPEFYTNPNFLDKKAVKPYSVKDYKKGIKEPGLQTSMDPIDLVGSGVYKGVAKALGAKEVVKGYIGLIEDAVKYAEKKNAFPTVLNTAENIGYELSTTPKKISPTYQTQAKAELEKANNWSESWYNDPATKERLLKLSEESNLQRAAEINKQRAFTRNNPSNLKNYTQDELNIIFADIKPTDLSNNWDEILKNIQNKSYISTFQSKNAKLQKILKGQPRTHEGNYGISGYMLDSDYKGVRQNLVNKYSPKIKSTGIHEGNHGLTDGNELLPISDQEDIVKIFGDNTKVPARNNKNQFNSYEEYLQDPTEVYARIMELREHFKMKPGEIIDDDTIFKIMADGEKAKTPVDASFFTLIKNPYKFKDLFNRLPVAIPAAIGVGALQQDKKQNTGWLDNLK